MVLPAIRVFARCAGAHLLRTLPRAVCCFPAQRATARRCFTHYAVTLTAYLLTHAAAAWFFASRLPALPTPPYLFYIRDNTTLRARCARAPRLRWRARRAAPSLLRTYTCHLLSTYRFVWFARVLALFLPPPHATHLPCRTYWFFCFYGIPTPHLHRNWRFLPTERAPLPPPATLPLPLHNAPSFPACGFVTCARSLLVWFLRCGSATILPTTFYLCWRTHY